MVLVESCRVEQLNKIKNFFFPTRPSCCWQLPYDCVTHCHYCWSSPRNETLGRPQRSSELLLWSFYDTLAGHTLYIFIVESFRATTETSAFQIPSALLLWLDRTGLEIGIYCKMRWSFYPTPDWGCFSERVELFNSNNTARNNNARTKSLAVWEGQEIWNRLKIWAAVVVAGKWQDVMIPLPSSVFLLLLLLATIPPQAMLNWKKGAVFSGGRILFQMLKLVRCFENGL